MELFKSLPEAKKQKILRVCIEEFAEYGYLNSSTNRIIHRAGISKGSLFKYFGSKEELYFYVLDFVAEHIMAELAPKMSQLPEDLLDRLAFLTKIEFELHMQKPLYFKLFQRAQVNDGSDIYFRVREKIGAGAEGMAREMLKDVVTDNLRYDKESSIQAVLWLLKGFNDSFAAEVPEGAEISFIQQDYLRKLEVYLNIIRNGIYK